MFVLVSVNQLLFFRLFADLLSFSGALGIEIIVNSLQEKVVTNTHMNKWNFFLDAIASTDLGLRESESKSVVLNPKSAGFWM